MERGDDPGSSAIARARALSAAVRNDGTRFARAVAKNDASPDRDAARRRRQQAGRLRRPYCLKGAGSSCPVSFPSKEWSAGRRQGLARPLNGPGEGPFARRYGQACETCPRGARPLWREGAAPPGAPPRRGRPAAPLPYRCRRPQKPRRPPARTAGGIISKKGGGVGDGAIGGFLFPPPLTMKSMYLSIHFSSGVASAIFRNGSSLAIKPRKARSPSSRRGANGSA